VDRTAKENWVTGLNQTLTAAEVVVVTHYNGMDVAAMTELRYSMREAGAQFTVTKNRLTRLALEGTRYGAISPLFDGPTAIAFSADVTAAPKAVADYARKNKNLIILGGAMGETILDADGVRALASLPSLDELRAQLIAVLLAPATKLAAVMQAPAGQVARVLSAYGEADRN